MRSAITCTESSSIGRFIALETCASTIATFIRYGFLDSAERIALSISELFKLPPCVVVKAYRTSIPISGFAAASAARAITFIAKS